MVKKIFKTWRLASDTLKNKYKKGNTIIKIMNTTVNVIYIGGSFLNEIPIFIYKISYLESKLIN